MSHKAGKDVPSLPSRQETSDLSDYTIDSGSTFLDSPNSAHAGSPIHHRTSYRRLASFNGQDTAYHGLDQSPRPSRNLEEHGLGIKNLKPLPSQIGVGSSGPPSSANPLLSPPLTQSRQDYQPVVDHTKENNGDWGDYTSRADPYQPFVAEPETERLHKQTTAATVQSFEPLGMHCTSFLPFSKSNQPTCKYGRMFLEPC